ncbi:MAG: lactonase family protein [Planctomycetota bacterium]|nr:lactonase family protein [Planctomycetota bacterium]
MLLIGLCWALSSSAIYAQSIPEQGPLMAYVGTFSSPLKDTLPTQVDLPPGNGRGIHIFQVDRKTGQASLRGELVLGTSPSCLATNAAQTILYSANETDRVEPQGSATGNATADKPKHGTVSSYAIDRKTGELKHLNTADSGGAGPTYVSVHPSQKYLLVANYFGGSIAVLPILQDGTLGTATDVQIDSGEIGPTRAVHAATGSFAFSGHDRTHAHMISADPSGRYVLHVDLGLDKIFIWKFDSSTGKLRAAEPPFVALPPGDGPRHFHFHPNGKWFYSIQEEGSTVVVYDWDSQVGRLHEKQTISTLPAGYAGSNFCSEILVSPDGRYVYAGNRLHDSIAIFSVGLDGTLRYETEESTRGNYPRSFTFDPTGEFLLCCNQRADHVAVFRVDRAMGRLQFTGQYLPVGNPSHVLFVDLGKN